jgi:uncharacterized protein YlxW (UPF0749 family)
MRVPSGQIAVGLTALLLAMMIVVQIRLQEVVPAPTHNAQLLALLKQSEQKRHQLAQQLARMSQLVDARLSEQAAAKKLQSQLVQAEMLAGTVPVQGPGIVIRWSNGQAPQAYQLNDIDLLLLMNELRAAGAEAISINGQRVTAQTEVRSAANYVMINQSETDAPFTIKAIGQPSTLRDALMLPGGLYQQSEQEGLSMSIVPEKTVTIPAAPPTPLSRMVAKKP